MEFQHRLLTPFDQLRVSGIASPLRVSPSNHLCGQFFSYLDTAHFLRQAQSLLRT